MGILRPWLVPVCELALDDGDLPIVIVADLRRDRAEVNYRNFSTWTLSVITRPLGPQIWGARVIILYEGGLT